MRSFVPMVMAAMVVIGCAGESHSAAHRNDPSPMITSGGGVLGGPIAQVLHIHVIDAESEAPVMGAHVRLDPGTTAPIEGDTQDSGLVTFDDPTLKGPQAVTVTKSGYVTTTWVGVDGANTTIVLQPDRAGSTPEVPTATAQGTIEGWDTLPEPAPRNYRVALIGYSGTRTIDDPANAIEQPTDASGNPLNLCFAAPGVSICDWRMNVRVGRQAHYAVILEGEQVGSMIDFERDRIEVAGYAIRTGVDAAEGESITGEALKRIDAADLIDLRVEFDAPPSTLPNAGAFPLLVLAGDEGQIPMFFPVLTEESTTIRVPALSGDFAGAQYDVFGRATPAAMVDNPSTTFFDRDVDPNTVVRIGPWLAPPANLSAGMGTISFTADDATNLHVASLGTADQIEWTFAFLDGSTTFTLPELAEDPLPSGELFMYVGAFEVDMFDPMEIRFEDGLSQAALRFADATGRVSR
jgi:hypothetical protein